MKASETVMDQKRRNRIIELEGFDTSVNDDYSMAELALCQAQADESFPAGQDELVKRFNEWADEFISTLDDLPSFSDEHRRHKVIRRGQLVNVKQNLARIAKEIKEGK